MANLALGLAGVLFLADREKRAFAIGHKASVAGRVLRPKTEHCNVGAVIQRLLQAHQRLGSDQRRVGIKHDDVARCLSSAGRAASTASAVPRCPF